MFNFLYSFEETYNTQALCSIISLLDQSKEKINIFILHDKPESFEKYEKLILDQKNLNSLTIYKFNEDDIDFPTNFKNSHLNVNAIYYRLFIEDYLPKNIDFILYVDADAYFIKDYSYKLNNEIARLKKAQTVISAQTGIDVDEGGNRLNLESGKYLNSGILLINYQLWIKNNCTSHFSRMLNEREVDFEWHDQDILSIFFDGNYEELDESLNFNIYGKQRLDSDLYEKIENKGIIVHYSGKFKPWSPKGVFAADSAYYYKIYRKLFENKYHIVNAWTPNTLRILLKNILNLKIFKLEYPFEYLKAVIASLFKN